MLATNVTQLATISLIFSSKRPTLAGQHATGQDRANLVEPCSADGHKRTNPPSRCSQVAPR